MQKRNRSTKRINNICVIGAGRFGSAVVDQLIEQDEPVLVIDFDEKQLSKYSSFPLITSITADAADIKALQSLGIDEIETVIVATPTYFVINRKGETITVHKNNRYMRGQEILY